MSHRQSLFFLIAISIVAGLIAGLLFISVAPRLPLVPTHPILKTLNINKPIVMGFMPYWLISKANPDSLNMLNNVTYFGMTIDTDGTLVRLDNPQETEPGWHTLNNDTFSELVKNRPAFQLEKSLLVHQADEASISALLTDPENHAVALVQDAEPIMKKYGFTDLNLDIESFSTASPSAQTAMSTFLRKVKNQMNERQLGTLTTELTVASLVKDHLLQPEVVGEVSDRVVLMAYDFNYRGSVVSGAVAPVGGAREKMEYDVVESIKLATQAIPAEKVLLGIPLYGYEWETLSYEPESPVIPGTGKTATGTRIEELLKSCNGCEVKRDEITGSPYVILPPNQESAIQQIYFEDAQSLKRKLELASQYNLGGVAFWAMGYESAELLSPVKDYAQTERR